MPSVMTGGHLGKTQLQRLGHPLGGNLDHGSAYRQQSRHLLERYCRRRRPCLQTIDACEMSPRWRQ